MVTYRFCIPKPQVRILAPHPLFFILAAFLLCGFADAADLDYYAVAPDTLAVSVSSSDSLARVVGGDVFGHYWSSFGGNGQITAIDGVSMTGRADGVQQLATATYSTFKGVESEIDSINASIAATEPWLEQIYNFLYLSSRSGDEVTKVSIPELMVQLRDEDVNTIIPGKYWYGDIINGVDLTSTSVPNLLAAMSSNDFHANFLKGFMFLGTNGELRYADRYISGTLVDNYGYVGLAYLLSGNEDHTIYGLDYNGDDKEGTRGSWSLSDIVANGFSGLAALISGPDSHREEYVWLGSSGMDQNGRTSLMDMVGEGFLGLAYDLWPDRRDSTKQVLLDFISPDDGVSHSLYVQDNLAQLLAGGFSGLQNPLARLAYVYADQDDIAFKKAEKPNIDAVKDSFFGDGQAAVNPGQIKDAAGISSSVKGSFAGAGDPGDAFVAINDSNSYWFFTQEVADTVDTVNSPSVQSDDNFLDRFVQDEDGFYSLVDLSPWNVGSYLGGD